MNTTAQMETSNAIVRKVHGFGNQQPRPFHYNVNRSTMGQVQRLVREDVGSSDPKSVVKRNTKAANMTANMEIRPNGCHEWTGYVMKSGYGQVRFNGKAVYAHRAIWEIQNGPIGSNYVLHKCDNRKCINTEHLFLGSFDENMQDMVQKKRQAHGMRNGHAKLTDSDVREIRAAIGTQKEIAARYGVTYSLVGMIRARKIWKYV